MHASENTFPPVRGLEDASNTLHPEISDYLSKWTNWVAAKCFVQRHMLWIYDLYPSRKIVIKEFWWSSGNFLSHLFEAKAKILILWNRF